LRNGTPVAGWLLKAAPGVWDLEAALAAGEVPTSWRLARSYRVALVRVGDPVVLWRTRGWSGPAGVVAFGSVEAPPSGGRRSSGATAGASGGPAIVDELPGDASDPRWLDAAARDRPRPRVHIRLEVLDDPLTLEQVANHPDLTGLEVRRVPRIGNPSVITPDQLQALESLL
jgi:hypothetical protein